MDTKLESYIEHFMEERIFRHLPDEKRDTDGLEIHMTPETLHVILFNCMEYVSEKIEQEVVAVNESQHAVKH